MAIDLFSIGPITVHGYGLMIGLGFIAGILVGSYLAQKSGLSADHFTNIAIWTIVIGFLGGKLLYVIVNFKHFLEAPLAVLGSEGFVVYGGIITGVITITTYCKVKKLSALSYLDLMVIAVALNQAFGRVGCFLAGCCYGRPTDSAIGVIFPAGCIAPAGIKLHPTQLYMAAGDLLIFLVLLFMHLGKKSFPKGFLCASYLTLYSFGRFLIEFVRDDAERGYVGVLSTSQFIAIWVAIAGLVCMYLLLKKSKSEPQTDKPEADNTTEKASDE